MNGSLPDIVAVTGTSRGLGEALVTELGRRGVHVVCIGRSFTDAQLALASHGHITTLTVDLERVEYEGVLRAFERLDRAGSSAALICNAATARPICRTGSGEGPGIANAVLGNVTGTIRVAEAFLRAWSASSAALAVINVSSGASTRPMKGWAAYCTSKAALDMYFACMALDHPSIHVASIDPGVIDTRMQGEIRSAAGPEFPTGTYLSELAQAGSLQTPEAAALRLLDNAFAIPTQLTK